MVGTSISHYKVTEKIGEGGMGEVYRVTDTKLTRNVALSFCPSSLPRIAALIASDPVMSAGYAVFE